MSIYFKKKIDGRWIDSACYLTLVILILRKPNIWRLMNTSMRMAKPNEKTPYAEWEKNTPLSLANVAVKLFFLQ